MRTGRARARLLLVRRLVGEKRGPDVTLEVTAEGEGVAAVRALFDEPAAAPAARWHDPPY